jgi:hypothetical protein
MQYLAPEQYIEEMNRILQAKPAYREGMRFEAFPPGASGADITGITWVPMWSGVMAIAAIETGAIYRLPE